MSNKYFATLPKDEIVNELDSREKDWFNHCKNTGIYNAQKRAYQAYYGENNSTKNGQITSVGEVGELKSLIVNEYRNFLLHIHNLTTQSKLNFQPRAVNSDSKSLHQAILSKSILDYYLRERDVQGILSEATEFAISTTEGYIKLDWREELGERILENKTAGDIEFRLYQGLNVARDPNKQSYRKNQWVILREKVNKYDLVAKYPELEERLLAVESKTEDETRTFFDNFFEKDLTTDDVYVKEFWHEKTPAVPEGRLVIYVEDVVLYDGPLPYSKTHIYRIAPSEFLGTSHGYSVAFDLLPVQETLDALVSAIVTNQTSFVGQNIAVKNGDGFELEGYGPLRVIKYNNEIPQAINFTNTPNEVFNFVETLRGFMGTMSAINEVIRGQVPDGVTAGNAMALIQAQAIQFNNSLARAYAKVSEEVGTGILDLLKQFAHTPRVAFIVGEGNKGNLQQFTKDDISNVSRVVVEVTNPIEATFQGRKALSDEWIQKGVLTPQKQLVFLRTGNLEAETQGIEQEYLLIKAENEQLSKGIPQPVMATDLHIEHLQEHRAVSASPEARKNPQIMAALLAHENEHLKALRTVDPQLLQAFNQPSLAPPPGQMAPPPLAPTGGNPVNENNPASQEPGMQGLPQPPTDPATGQEAQLANPALPKI